MKVKAIKDYFDLELNKAVKTLDEYEVSAARAKALSSSENKAGYPLVEIIEDEKPKKAAKKKVEE